MDFTDQDLENLFKKYFDSYKDKDINNVRIPVKTATESD
jgi:hypothetical protein